MRGITRLCAVGALAAASVLGSGEAHASMSHEPGSLLIWKLQAGFAAAPHEANPSTDAYGNPGVWWFMRGTHARHPRTFRLIRAQFRSATCGIPGLEAWVGAFVSPPVINLPFVGKNATGAAQTLCVSGGLHWPARAVLVHPTPRKAVVVGWRSPIAGTVYVGARATDVDPTCGNGVVWRIETAQAGATGALRFRARIENGGTAGTMFSGLPVIPGEFLYSVINAGNHDDQCDTTRLRFIVRTSPG